ncbi:MAG: hypothetical protein ACRD4I_06000 [Candidatus Angelobacter sp.]
MLRFRPAIALVFGVVALAGQKNTEHVDKLHAAIPAGYEIIMLQPSGIRMSLLGLVECPKLEGAQHVSEGYHARVVAADGSAIQQFPRYFSFRITASLRKILLDAPTRTLTSREDPQQLLLKLGFVLKGYEGLNVFELHPRSVNIIGVPASIPYDERVYRVSFDVGERAVSDRFVLEVLSPAGERLARFHFELV